MPQSLRDADLSHLTASLDLAHQHGSLNGRNAKICQPFLLGVLKGKLTASGGVEPVEHLIKLLAQNQANHGFQANIADLRKRYPEIQLQTLEQWLYNEGWHKRARYIRPPKGWRDTVVSRHPRFTAFSSQPG